MAHVDTGDLVSITDANRAGLSALVRAAESGREQVSWFGTTSQSPR